MVLNVKRSSSLDSDVPSDVLKPFPHQVGGHTPLSSLHNGHLLKPCDEREIYFYQHMPIALHTVTPRCCTTIQGPSVSLTKMCCEECAKVPIENVLLPESMEGSPILNKRKLSRNFVVISDMTANLRHPCVLDLKIGTRQHGDRATCAKAAIQIEKCRSTTSASLGIRLCGMKYFSPETDELITVDKYKGRALDEGGLRKAVQLFFSQSSNAKIEIRRRIKVIREVLAKSEGLRLFGSSLLIVIDCSPPIDTNDEDVAKVCIVDFANATFRGFAGDGVYEGVDEGSIMGLDTLERFLA